MKINAFIYHKRAEKYTECQDCFGINSQNNRIAVSDGVSQSIFPRWCAKILVDDFLKNGHIAKDISPLQEEWQQKLRDEIQGRKEEAITNPQRDPWRLENSLAEKSGAGATLCGLTVEDKELSCECLGDSCLIAINHDYTLNIYTSQVGEFSNTPDYFDSFGKGRGEPICKTINRDVKALLLVTDPFAELFQKQDCNRKFIKSRFDELQSLTNHEAFTKLVESWRDEYGMHNDDSTLILITDCSKNDFEIEHADDWEQLCQEEKNDAKQASLAVPKTISEPKEEEPEVDSKEVQSRNEEAVVERLKSFFKDKMLDYSPGKKNKKEYIKMIKKECNNICNKAMSRLSPDIKDHFKS